MKQQEREQRPGQRQLPFDRTAEAAVGHLDVDPVDEERRDAELAHRAERRDRPTGAAAPPTRSTRRSPATSTPTRRKKNEGAVRQNSVGPNHDGPCAAISRPDPQRHAADAEPDDQPPLGHGVARAIDQHADRGAGEHEAGPREQARTSSGRRTAGDTPRAASGSASRAPQTPGCPASRTRGRRPRRSIRRCASPASAPAPRSRRRRRSPAPSR